jgi:putative ABC transport system permease protein
MDNLIKDIRFSLRSLRHRPGFTAVIVITMALGIGANTAIFSVISGVLLKSLPYPASDRIMFILERNESRFNGLLPMSALNYRDLKEQSQSFQFMAGRRPFAASLMTGDRPERILGEQATADYFDVLGAPPVLGHRFTSDDEKPGAGQVALISAGLWKRRFASDPAIVGQSIRMDGKSVTILGIMPDDYRPGIEFWMPLVINYEGADRDFHDTQVVGRLAAGIGPAQAQAEMTSLASGLADQYPEINTGWEAVVVPMHDQIVSNIRPALLVLLAAVGLVLLIACSNVANLLLARVATREREIAIRMALGAGRSGLTRYIMTESLLLSFVGGVAGVTIATWGTSLLINLNRKGIPLANEISVDWRVLLFAVGISIVSGTLFGLFPSLQVARSNLCDALKESGRSLVGSRHSRRLRSGLVVIEVALSLVLLVAAGLSIKSFGRLTRVQAGFDPDNLLSFQLFLPAAEYPNQSTQLEFQKEVIRRLSQLPGVKSAAAASVVPLANPGPRFIFWAEGHPLPAPHDAPIASYRVVSSGYFTTMSIPLLAGREFEDTDQKTTLQVGVINKEMAERMWPGENPVGKRFSVGVPLDAKDSVDWVTVVGVVGGVRQTSLNAEPGMEMYQPLAQAPFPGVSFVARTSLDAGTMAEPARSLIASLNSDLPLTNLKSMDEILHDSVAPYRFNMLLLAIFGCAALILSAVGVFGVISYSVSNRVQEIGIRMALGASSGQVGRLVVGEGMVLTIIGLAIGFGVSLWSMRLMAGLLFDVGTADGLTMACVAALMAFVSLMACYIPARRAMRVDPMIALRQD